MNHATVLHLTQELFLMLAGAVNTAIIGSNGVLNRVSEDGVLTDWFRAPHKKYGTTYRMINLIVLLHDFILPATAPQSAICRGLFPSA